LTWVKRCRVRPAASLRGVLPRLICVNAAQAGAPRLNSNPAPAAPHDGDCSTSYRTLLVHLDNSDHTQRRLEIALRIARQFDAQIRGLYVTFTPAPRL
jgi:hypothetical protein